MKRILAITISVAILAAFAGAQDKEIKYSNNSFARINYVAGGNYIQRAQDLGYEEAELNAPITEGDRIGTTDGRLEIYLGKRTYIRLDQNSKVDFAALPRRDSSLIRIRQWAGRIYLEAGSLEKEKSIEILTDDATFYILDKGLYRIDVKEHGATEIIVYQGMIEAAGADGSMLVKGAQRLALTEGRFQGRPAAYYAAGTEDEFDRFNATRSATVNRQMAKKILPEDLADFDSELSDYGDWVNEPEVGDVWVPRGMGADWRPYSMGHWMWIPMAGWTWVPLEPWGWAPYHYGRWHWGLGLGWYWIPMNMWGPAWVNWWWDDMYFGWCPLSYWGYPGVLYGNMFYGRGWRGDYPHDSRALTVVRRDQLQARNVQKVALGDDSLKALGRISMSPHFPDNILSTSNRQLSVEPLDNGRVLLRKGGDGTDASTGNVGRTGDTSVTRTVDRKTGETIANTRARGGEIKSGDAKAGNTQGADTRRVDARSKGEAGQVANPPSKTTTGSTNSGERKIRIKEGEPSSAAVSSYSSASGFTGYPSAKSISRERAISGRSSSDSLLGNIYRRYSSGSSATSSSSSSGSSSRGAVSRGSSSSSGHSSSSSGRSSSGSSSRSGSGSSHSSGGGGHHR